MRGEAPRHGNPELPSSDQLVQELEQFLRQQRRDSRLNESSCRSDATLRRVAPRLRACAEVSAVLSGI